MTPLGTTVTCFAGSIHSQIGKFKLFEPAWANRVVTLTQVSKAQDFTIYVFLVGEMVPPHLMAVHGPLPQHQIAAGKF